MKSVMPIKTSITRRCTRLSCLFCCCRSQPIVCSRVGRGCCSQDEDKADATAGKCDISEYGHSYRRLIPCLGASLSRGRRRCPAFALANGQISRQADANGSLLASSCGFYEGICGRARDGVRALAPHLICP